MCVQSVVSGNSLSSWRLLLCANLLSNVLARLAISRRILPSERTTVLLAAVQASRSPEASCLSAMEDTCRHVVLMSSFFFRVDGWTEGHKRYV